jgi:hypothetical protein
MNKAPLIVAWFFLSRWLFVVDSVYGQQGKPQPDEKQPTITDFETGSIERGPFQPRTEFAAGAPIRVRVKIDSNSTYVNTPWLALGAPPYGPFQPGVQMTHTTGNMYEATLHGQPYGAYQLQLTVSYVLSLPHSIEELFLEWRKQTRSRPFFVEARAGCFAFDTTPDPEGWTFEGVFDSDTSTHVETCSQADLNGLLDWQSGMTFPAGPLGVTPAEGHGSIRFWATNNCFPNSVPSGFSRVDFVSPNLASRAEWQGISGFSARVHAGAIRLYPRVWAQPLITVKDSEGATRIFRPASVNGKPYFPRLTDGWTEIRFDNAPLPAGSTVLNVRVRLFLESITIGELNTATFLDGVCPIPK